MTLKKETGKVLFARQCSPDMLGRVSLLDFDSHSLFFFFDLELYALVRLSSVSL